MKKYLIPLTALFLLTSCENMEKKSKVSGTIYDISGNRVAGTWVEITTSIFSPGEQQGETYANEMGEYNLENIPEGEYFVFASSTTDIGPKIGWEEISLSNKFDPFGNNSVSVDVVVSTRDPGIVYKPNIYLYPKETQKVQVKIKENNECKIIKSEPSYGNGWDVLVTQESKIDEKYSYLFYEAQIPPLPNKGKGWNIEAKKIPSFFRNTLYQYGFSNQEINDFIEYWSGNLPNSPYYSIIPIDTSFLQKLIPLVINPNPDSLLRIWFIIKPIKEPFPIKKPTINKFKRNGFTVTEWGVIL